MNDWTAMAEDEKYIEWSEYVTEPLFPNMPPPVVDYSEYCDWMDRWEKNHA